MMNGQWIGPYTGSSDGQLVVNIDERQDCYEGVAYLNESNLQIPTTIAHFKTKNKDAEFQCDTDLILSFDPTSANAVPWETVKKAYPDNISVSKRATVNGSLTDSTLKLSWTTDIPQVHGTALLPRSEADKPSKLPTEEKDWHGFKQYVSSIETRKFLFRGQNRPWRLRTSFHRAGRTYLERFLRDDVPGLYRHLSARTKHVFNLAIPEQNGAFYNLVQHHGYPTPLLDWTYSPYVAAFFAYRGITNEASESALPTDKVRVIVFDQAEWRTWTQLSHLVMPGLHVSIQEFLAIENERMIPQQAASTITNVDDIESYITTKSKSTEYLSAIDLPVSDRGKVMRELGYMGITAGALFPGLDGACEELKERNFKL